MESEILKGYVFSDLYFDESGSSPPLVRGLVKGVEGEVRPGHLVERFPKVLMEDLRKLARMVILHNRTTRMREFTVDFDEVRYRCAMIASPNSVTSGEGEKISWCLRRIMEKVPQLTEFGLNKWISSRLASTKTSRGLTLISGPFGSGKTTVSSSAFLDWIKTSGEIGVSLEDPPEIDFSKQDLPDGRIYQINLVDQSMSEAIRFSRRWAPRHILIGEIRSPEAAVEMLSMAKSGPAVITTIHASDTVSAISQLIQFASGRMSENDARETVSACLFGVLHIDSRMSADAAKYLSVGEKKDNSVRMAIVDGKYGTINEELQRQSILRSK